MKLGKHESIGAGPDGVELVVGDIKDREACLAVAEGVDIGDNTISVIRKPIKIGSRVWIGFGAIILPGLTIGVGAIVGAGSVVTKGAQYYSRWCACSCYQEILN